MEIKKAMIEKSNKRKKCFVSEEDISTLLQRYKATTVLALLQEVAQVADVKIDWNALVKKTTTGITNAREYQMLWRHLAYRHGLVDRLDDDALPLDDDSDLEYEHEAAPAVGCEASTEAAACVKVLIGSGMPSESCLSNGTTVEAPLTINIPTCSENSYQSSSMQGTNITVPVTVQMQPLPNVTTAEGLETNGTSNSTLPPRRKRKPWSEAEDLELIAAVQKCGEGNWANILKGDFKGDRTASQLSQRWAIIRKRQGTLVGNSSQLSEAQLAARRAMSLALDMPIGNNAKPHSAAAETSLSGTRNHFGQPDSAMAGSLKSRVFSKTAVTPDSMVKAAAVAAGARIATPSDAASHLKAAQSKNAVRIMPGGGSLVKPTVVVGSNALPSNVHFIRTGLLSHSKSMPNAARTGAQPIQGHSPKPAQSNPIAATVSGSKVSAVVSNGSNITPPELGIVAQKLVKESQAGEKIEETRVSCNVPPKENGQGNQASVSAATATVCVKEKQINSAPVGQKMNEKHSADRNQTGPSSMDVDGAQMEHLNMRK